MMCVAWRGVVGDTNAWPWTAASYASVGSASIDAFGTFDGSQLSASSGRKSFTTSGYLRSSNTGISGLENMAGQLTSSWDAGNTFPIIADATGSFGASSVVYHLYEDFSDGTTRSPYYFHQRLTPSQISWLSPIVSNVSMVVGDTNAWPWYVATNVTVGSASVEEFVTFDGTQLSLSSGRKSFTTSGYLRSSNTGISGL